MTLDEKIDEILEGVMDDATLWYIGRITEKEYWDTHQKAKQAIKQLIEEEVAMDSWRVMASGE